MNIDRDQATADELSVLNHAFARVAESIATPAFVYEEEFIRHRCEHIRQIADKGGLQITLQSQGAKLCLGRWS